MRRRHVVFGIGAAGLLATLRIGAPRLARPAPPDGPLSAAALALIDAAWKGLDPARVLDTHVHIVGTGGSGSGCYVNPKMSGAFPHLLNYVKFSVYCAAAGVSDEKQGDAQFLAALVDRIRSQKRHGRALALAFDQVHREDGTPSPEQSEFHTPNEYVLKLAREYPDCFLACASIHPYRKDAVEALEKAAEGGAVAMKWLPNAQQMDPASPRCDALYAKMAALGIPLITHAGEEKAVEAEEMQKLGNPLRLRRALDAGVKVIVAHAGSLGEGEDLDAPGDAKPLVPNFDLFLRMAAEPRAKGQLFADLSALVQVNRCEGPLRTLLSREELHGQLVNGSDYPLPAINALVRTGKLEELGYLTSAEREWLNEIDRHNPLLFDFVTKRTLKVVEGDKLHRFPDRAFELRADLFPRVR